MGETLERRVRPRVIVALTATVLLFSLPVTPLFQRLGLTAGPAAVLITLGKRGKL